MSVQSVLDTPFKIKTVICNSDSDGEGAVDISTDSIEISRQIFEHVVNRRYMMYCTVIFKQKYKSKQMLQLRMNRCKYYD